MPLLKRSGKPTLQYDIDDFTDEWKNARAGYFDKMCTDAAWARLHGLVYLNYEGDAHPSFQNNDGEIMQKTHWDPRMKENT